MNKETIIKEIKDYYRFEDNDYMDSGCYVNGKWLSVEKIIEIIEEL